MSKKRMLIIFAIILVVIGGIFMIFKGYKNDKWETAKLNDLKGTEYRLKRIELAIEGEKITRIQLNCELYNAMYGTDFIYNQLTKSEKHFFEKNNLADIYNKVVIIENHNNAVASSGGKTNDGIIDVEIFFGLSAEDESERVYMNSGVRKERLAFNCELYNLMYGTNFYPVTNVSDENRRFFESVTVYSLVHDGVKIDE